MTIGQLHALHDVAADAEIEKRPREIQYDERECHHTESRGCEETGK